jgi:hypothetical protein
MDELEDSQKAERIVIVRPVLHDLAAGSYFEHAWPAPDQLYNYPPENIMKTYQTVLIGGLMALGLAACSSTSTSSDMSSGSTSSGSSMSSGSTGTGTSTAASDNGADNNAGAGASNNATNTGTPTAPSTATSTSGGANR